MEFLTQVFQKTLDRKGFDCGNGALNKYIREQAGQDMDRKLSIVYAMTEGALIKGYYSLSNYSQPTEFFPPEIQKRFPPTHTHIPTTLLGRLAIDNQFQGQGLGSQLLMDAMKRALLASKVIASTDRSSAG